jgi:type IV pilus assembly protein PilO
MALIPQDQRGQILLLLTVGAVVVGYFGWSGLSVVGLAGYGPMGLHRDSLRAEMEAINSQVSNAKRDVARGTLTEMEQRLAEFNASLTQMRQLVPTSAEVPNLLDDIASRAKMRGATLGNFTPQAVESGSPFDTQRYRLAAAGQYDQVAEFLTDIASLPRIIVPYDVHFQRIMGPVADTSQVQSLLQATFSVRTYVKPGVTESAAGGTAAPGRGGDD